MGLSRAIDVDAADLRYCSLLRLQQRDAVLAGRSFLAVRSLRLPRSRWFEQSFVEQLMGSRRVGVAVLVVGAILQVNGEAQRRLMVKAIAWLEVTSSISAMSAQRPICGGGSHAGDP